VVAIIAILAAIAIPQFAQYRMRGFNASSLSDLRNGRTTQEALFSDWQRYGRTDTANNGTAAAGVMLTGPTNPVTNATQFTLTDAVGTPRNLLTAVGNNITLMANVDAGYQSYTIACKHNSGDTAYAADSDSTANFRQQNAAWVGQNIGAAAPPVASVAGVVEAVYTAAPWGSM